MSNKKIKEELGWTPKYSIDDGLSKTIEYYENQREEIRRSLCWNPRNFRMIEDFLLSLLIKGISMSVLVKK